MATASSLETTLQPSALKPTIAAATEIKGLSKQRMRVDGKKVSEDEFKKKIIALLARPMTTAEIAEALKRSSTKSLRRDWLAPMLQEGLIEQHGDHYTRKGVAEVQVARENFDDLVRKSAFNQLPIMADFVKHCATLDNGKGDLSWATKFWKVCIGKTVPSFKCRPEHWTPETTLRFTEAYRQHKKIDRLGGDWRQLIRYVHEYVLHKPVTDLEKNAWGVDGTKDNAGIYSHIKLTEQQINQLLDYFVNKGDLELAAYCSAAIEMFGRPEAMFRARQGTMQLVQRTRYCAIVAGDPQPNFDPIAVRQMRIIAAINPQLVQIKEVKDEIFAGTLKEFKTAHAPWPKYIVEKRRVALFKEYLQTRKGKETYFGADGEPYWKFNCRLAAAMRPAFYELGLIHHLTNVPEKGTTEWYYFRKPTYVFRHIGAHLWLARLGSYEALAEMGWEDVGIPKKFYAGSNVLTLEQKIAVAC